MAKWIALFRGINVGGNNVVRMADLKKDLEALNCVNIQTYIQSGNVVFESRSRNATNLARKIEQTIEKRHGFRPRLILLTESQLTEAMDNNPFQKHFLPKSDLDPRTLHLFFLSRKPEQADMSAIKSSLSESEEFRLVDQVFFLFAPQGIGRSKLAANVEKYLGVDCTARNFRTVSKLLEMVQVKQ